MQRDLPLSDVHFFLMERIMRTARVITREVFEANEIPISVDQWVLLKRIAEQEGLTQKEVAESTFKEPAAVTRMLKHMQQADWVYKEANPNDLRQFQLHLTEAGRELHDRALPLVKQMRHWALESLSPQERVQLREMLKQVDQSLQGRE